MKVKNTGTRAVVYERGPQGVKVIHPGKIVEMEPKAAEKICKDRKALSVLDDKKKTEKKAE